MVELFRVEHTRWHGCHAGDKGLGLIGRELTAHELGGATVLILVGAVDEDYAGDPVTRLSAAPDRRLVVRVRQLLCEQELVGRTVASLGDDDMEPAAIGGQRTTNSDVRTGRVRL